MFLFIFESIGTSELILIAVVALIVFGPRKLPQMAKTIGKTMADFRNATNEFKSTWEKEVSFEDDEKKAFTLPDIEHRAIVNEKVFSAGISEQSEVTTDSQTENELSLPKPTIKELSASDIAEKFHGINPTKELPKNVSKTFESSASDKRDWL